MSRSGDPTTRAEPIAARLDELAERLARLEAVDVDEDEPPRRLATRLTRLEATVDDLARENRLLHRRLAELAERSGSDGTGAATAAAATAPLAEPGNLKETLRSLLRRVRELWRVTDPTLIGPLHQQLETGPRRALPGLAVVFVTDDDEPPGDELLAVMERQTAAVSEWIFWRRTGGSFQVRRGDGSVVREGRAGNVEELRQATEAACLLTAGDDFTRLAPTAIELAWLSLAGEDLAFVELPPRRGKAVPAGLLVAKELWRDDGLVDGPALEKRLRSRSRRVVGKILPCPGGGGRAWLSRPGELHGWRQSGRYVIGNPARGGAIRHRLHELDAAAAARPEKLAWALLVDAPLAGGLERLVAELLPRLTASLGDPLVASLRPGDALQAERLTALARITPRVYPLADVLPGDLHPSILESWIDGHGITTVVHLRNAGPAIPYTENLRQALPAIAWHQLPGDRLPGDRLPGSRSSGGQDLDWERRLWAGAAVRRAAAVDDNTARRSLRQRLGVPPETVLVTQIGDLISSRRPEDFVALAHHLRDDDRFFFLLRGRGPLRGTVEDLATFFALDNFRLHAGVELDAVLAASDIVCSTAEDEPWPFDLAEAMARERPVVACAPQIGELGSDDGITVAGVGDLGSFAQALETLSDGETRRRQGAAARRLILSHADEGD